MEEINCFSDIGHKANCWKKETSAECSFSPSIPASPSLGRGRRLKSICAFQEKHVDSPAIPKSHRFLWVFRALHVLKMQAGHWEVQQTEREMGGLQLSSSDGLIGFSILQGEERGWQLHFSFIQRLLFLHFNFFFFTTKRKQSSDEMPEYSCKQKSFFK